MAVIHPISNGQRGKKKMWGHQGHFCSLHFYCMHATSLQSCLLSATPWTVARQAALSMGFPRQEYCSGLSFPSPGDLPDPWPSFPGKNTAVGCHFLSRGPSWPSWSNLCLLSLVHWQAGSVALAPPGKSLLVQLAVMYLPSAHQVTLWARYWLTIYEVSADCVAWSQVERKTVYPHLRPAHFP